MNEFIDLLNHYTKSELMILVPVLYGICHLLNTTSVEKSRIPLITCSISIALCGLHIFSTVDISGFQLVLMAVFTSITQGLLVAYTATFLNFNAIHKKEIKAMQNSSQDRKGEDDNKKNDSI